MTFQTSMVALIRKAAAVGLLVLASGCASIFNGSIQVVGVESTPPGAAVWLDGQRMEKTTPMVLTLDRGYTNHVVRVQMEGYAPVETVLASHYSLWLGADIAVCFTGVGLVPGILGFLVDLGSGTGFYYSPDPIDVCLNSSGPLSTFPSNRASAPSTPASFPATSKSSAPAPAAPTLKPKPSASKPNKVSKNTPAVSPAEPSEVPPADVEDLPPNIRKQYDGLLKMRAEGVISQDEFEDLERILLEGR